MSRNVFDLLFWYRSNSYVLLSTLFVNSELEIILILISNKFCFVLYTYSIKSSRPQLTSVAVITLLSMLKIIDLFYSLKIILMSNFLYFCFRFLSPLSAVPLVALSGFGLYELGFPVVSIFATRTSPCFVVFFLYFKIITCDSHSFDWCFWILACKMCGDWAARNLHPNSIFTGDL